MCGRFYNRRIKEIQKYFRSLYGLDITLPENENTIPPGPDFLPWNDVPTVFNHEDTFKLHSMFWNLIPSSTKDFKPPKTWFNTRKERLEESYQQNLLRYKRCVIPVSGFIENKKKRDGQPVFHTRRIDKYPTRKKESYDFRHSKDSIMALGGIYDTWNQDNQSKRYSCSIITLQPNELIGEIHDRMPFILPSDKVELWLDPKLDDAAFLQDLIIPYPTDQLIRTRRWPPEHTANQIELF